LAQKDQPLCGGGRFWQPRGQNQRAAAPHGLA